MIVRATITSTALVLPGPAVACTLCYTDTAERVRAALFGPDLPANAAAILAPAPVLLAAWWLISVGVSRGR